MKYKIKFSNGRVTSLKFHNYENAAWYLKKILKYELKNYKYMKRDIEAKIISQDGIPF